LLILVGFQKNKKYYDVVVTGSLAATGENIGSEHLYIISVVNSVQKKPSGGPRKGCELI
jgi:hypothetical protein